MYGCLLENQGDVVLAGSGCATRNCAPVCDYWWKCWTNMPQARLATAWRTPQNAAEGFAAVESWRGEILCFVRFAADNTISRYWPRDPSMHQLAGAGKVGAGQHRSRLSGL